MPYSLVDTAMPFASKSQQKWMYANHPRMAKRWSRHTKDFKSLPEHVSNSDRDTTKEGSSMIAALAKEAADAQLVTKLAADTDVSVELIEKFAGMVNCDPGTFAKAAYADPANYVLFLKVATGAVKQAGPPILGGSKMVSLIASLLKQRAGQAAGKIQAAAIKHPKTAIGTGVGTTGTLGLLAMRGGGGQDVSPQETPASPPAEPAAQPPQPPAEINAAKPGGTPTTTPPANSPQPATGGMSPSSKMLLGAAGVGAAGLGAGMVANRMSKKKDEKSAAAKDFVHQTLRTALVKKAAAVVKQAAAKDFCAYLDSLAAKVPVEKTAAIRTVQREIAAGRTLAHAIKTAFPTVNPERRGVIASELVKDAVDWKQAAMKQAAMKQVGREEFHGKYSDGQKKMKEMCG